MNTTIVQANSQLLSDFVKLDALSHHTRMDVQRFLGAVDRVHRVRGLPMVTVIENRLLKDETGIYQRTGCSIELAHGIHGANRMLTIGRAFGHYLDHEAFRQQHHGWYSMSSAWELWPLKRALYESSAVRDLRKMCAAALMGEDEANALLTASWAALPGLFARAYAQYIATRAGDTDLLGYIDEVVSGRKRYGHPATQWAGDAFEPIAREFDKLLRSWGWLPKGD